tara:strand:- start:337 stop:576 length:240 start_codon:yes stop_codon:yes gene_type:complete
MVYFTNDALMVVLIEAGVTDTVSDATFSSNCHCGAMLWTCYLTGIARAVIVNGATNTIVSRPYKTRRANAIVAGSAGNS